MRLLRIRMEHFRSFYGSNELEFSATDSSPVTVIHGENGVGKTTILNAVFWCFYGKTTASFSNSDQIINRTAIDEGRAWAAVDVHFLHETQEYVARRGIKNGSEESVFAVHSVDADGNYESLAKPWAFINSVLPETMAPYFFFHGEGPTHRSSNQRHSRILFCQRRKRRPSFHCQERLDPSGQGAGARAEAAEYCHRGEANLSRSD